MHSDKLFLLAGIIAVFIYSCSNSSKQRDSIPSYPADAPAITQEAKDSIIYPGEYDTIHIMTQNGRAHLRIHKEERQNVNFSFDSQGYTKLTANLSSNDSLANIRFTQIGMPDGDMDGPFGATITYDLDNPGRYLLFVGDNQMAGDPWGGIFDIDIELSR